eukprot:4599148-Prymnesium_polylepis.1
MGAPGRGCESCRDQPSASAPHAPRARFAPSARPPPPAPPPPPPRAAPPPWHAAPRACVPPSPFAACLRARAGAAQLGRAEGWRA